MNDSEHDDTLALDVANENVFAYAVEEEARCQVGFEAENPRVLAKPIEGQRDVVEVLVGGLSPPLFHRVALDLTEVAERTLRQKHGGELGLFARAQSLAFLSPAFLRSARRLPRYGTVRP